MKLASLAAAVCLLLSACASAPVLPVRLPGAAAVELAQTPFFPQEEYQCGPAALATVLTASHAETTPEQLVPQIYVPARKGSLQAEMPAAARRHGRVPLPVTDGLQGLAAVLSAGFPVLVLQNLALDWWPVWHYAVVIGFDPARDEIVLRSGAERRLVMPARRFLVSWKRSGYWGLVIADPGQPPPFANARSWIEAASALEPSGSALKAYEAAAVRWPSEPLVWQALGNGRHAAGDRGGAVSAYRHGLELQKAPETYNNLAYVLAESGCRQEAARLIETALAEAPESPLRPQLLQTRQELLGMPAGQCPY